MKRGAATRWELLMVGVTSAGFVLGCGGMVPLDELGAGVGPGAGDPDDGVAAVEPVTDDEPEEAPEAEAAPEDAVDAADISVAALAVAEELLEAELAPPPFSEEEPEELADEVRAERLEALAAWVVETPEVVARRKLVVDRLQSHADEAAAEAYAGVVADFDASDPAKVEVATAPWRVVVAYAQYYDTSEDWAFFVNDVFEAGKGHAIGSGYLSKGATQLQVTRRGIAVATIDLPPETREPFAQGYVAAMEGKEPLLLGHDQPDELLFDLSDYFGVTLRR